MVEAQVETNHRRPPESLHMSPSPATDRDAVTVVVPMHNLAAAKRDGKAEARTVWLHVEPRHDGH